MNQSKLLAYSFALSSSIMLSACGNSENIGNTNEDSTADIHSTSLTGDLEIAVTDAEEDFLSYRIELESIQLKKANGTQVEVLPLESEIDFVQYQELSELFAVLSVPAGEYQSIVLGLDYSNADIVIQDEAGTSYQASIQDSDGNAIEQIDIELNLNDSESIYISPFKAAQLTLDLDLEASNTIESFDPPLVTVEPFMVGSTSLDMDREHRVRGLLNDVNTDNNTLAIDLIPMRLRQGKFGEYQVNVDENTTYEINGEEYTSEDGLALLAQQDEDTPVVSFGSHSEEERNYLATQILAGTSVPWAEQDVLKGTITARGEDGISIRGAVVELDSKSGHFQTDVMLQVSNETIVTGYRLGDSDISNLSVGQRILALGEFNAENNEFDSTEGQVRMKLNTIIGEVVQVSPLELDLSHVNKRPSELFDFAGTGLDTANDADPDHYEINSSTLDISSVETEELMQIRGYPSAYGSSPTDFDALSIINPEISSHPARMSASWHEANTTAITVESGELLLALDDAKSKLHLKGIPGSSRLEFSVEKLISTEGEGRFSILTKDQGIHSFGDFESFLNSANTYLQQGLAIRRITASGQYSDQEQTLDADYVTLRLAEINK
jgi:hypothetical protein